MRSFVHDQPPIRVVFGAGTIDRLADEVRRLGTRCALVLSTPGQRRLAEAVAQRLDGLLAGVCADVVMHVPIETVRVACAAATRLDADCSVAIGGGSTIGLAKAIALDRDQPIIAVPTTYSGSEMTPIYGFTENGVKRTGRDPRVLPKTVVYDPALSVTLPARLSGPSGLNALAHCVEALYAADATPISSLLAAEGIRTLARSLPEVVKAPADLDARTDALYGAWLAGSVLAVTRMGLHHKLCHVLGGTFGLPHADVHAVMLPHATGFNHEAAPAAMRMVADALETGDAAQGIYDLAVRLGAPVSLKAIGMPFDGLDRAAQLATESAYDNPRPIDVESARQLLDDAYAGKRPGR